MICFLVLPTQETSPSATEDLVWSMVGPKVSICRLFRNFRSPSFIDMTLWRFIHQGGYKSDHALEPQGANQCLFSKDKTAVGLPDVLKFKQSATHSSALGTLTSRGRVHCGN